MNDLFIRLYLDEDVDVLVAKLLKAKGFDALTTRDAGNLQVSDPEQLAYSVSEQRTFVTHNRGDFEELIQQYFVAKQMHYGIFLSVRRPPQTIARLLMTVLNQVTADEMVNQIRYI